MTAPGFWRYMLREMDSSWQTLTFSLSLWLFLVWIMSLADASSAAFSAGIVLVMLLQWEVQP